jgi:hypothetical protein
MSCSGHNCGRHTEGHGGTWPAHGGEPHEWCAQPAPVPTALLPRARIHHPPSRRLSPLCAVVSKLPDSASAELLKIAKHILPFPTGAVDTQTLHKVATVVTDELLILALQAVSAVSQTQNPVPSGKAQKRLLAWVIAAAVGGTLLTDQERATTVGKRLDTQAERVSEKLREISNAASTCSAPPRPTRRTIQDSADQKLMELNAAEQMALDTMRTGVYTNAAELLPMEPVPHDAPVPVLQSVPPSHDDYRRRTRQARALEAAAPAGLLDPFDEGFDEG